jgi:CHRD domain
MLKVIVVVASALAVAGLASAAGQADIYKLRATLTAGAEVPKPKGVSAGARGHFTGKSVELANDKARLTWKLTFSGLSGKAVAAHIHLGRKGKAGGVLVALCGPCRNGQTGRATITHAQHDKIEAGLTYVNVHTPRNGGGEIRGQVRVTELD